MGDLSGAEEKAGLDGVGWGCGLCVAGVAQVEDTGGGDEGGLGEGFSDECEVEDGAGREERLVHYKERGVRMWGLSGMKWS